MSDTRGKEEVEHGSDGRAQHFWKFLGSPRFKLYSSYAFSTWGDRMWTFALSIALVDIGNLSFRLAATSQLVNGLTVFFLGAVVGRWIDTTGRLRAASLSLTVNNAAVALSAGSLVALLHWPETVGSVWDGRLSNLLIALSIILCAVSVLGGTGTKICVSKDWVVVISRGDREKLATMNTWLVRIDLAAMILSPLLAGQIMASVSIAAGCFFISAWNVCSFGIELILLRAVYKSFPELATKKSKNSTLSQEILGGGPISKDASSNAEDQTEMRILEGTSAEADTVSEKPTRPARKRGIAAGITRALISPISGWNCYFRQTVFPAAIGLALLYLTVLGLDGITSGYAYSQGIKENILALVRGAGALTGIFGSFLFPKLRSKIGIERTGLISLLAEVSCLCISVASIWLPGSPFDLDQVFSGKGALKQNQTFNETTVSTTLETLTHQFRYPSSMCSIWAFLSGIVCARIGLWMADLSITQIMQERVAEHERGVIFGVQSAMNQLFSLLKDVLVILLPNPQTFGVLIIVSWVSVSCGFLSYSVYSRRVRGHLLPFHSLKFKKMNQNGPPEERTATR